MNSLAVPSTDMAPAQPSGADVRPTLLDVRELRVTLGDADRPLRPVDGVSFRIGAGETLALLGESGCGKSMTALALMRLLPPGGRLEAAQLSFDGRALHTLSERDMRGVRGGGIGMVFQEPGTSLNPVMSIGAQLAEALALHQGLGGRAARDEAARLLAAVGIADPARRLDAFPFQLSGGMKQRVMIALALAGEPRLLIADEPTTALDVTLQAQVLDLLAGLQRERGMGMLLITHDLGVVARVAQRVGVMYAGVLVENAPRDAFFTRPLHPYSRKLFAALPDGARGRWLDALPGSVPGLGTPFPGCRFVARCPDAFGPCADVPPPWVDMGTSQVCCHLYADAAAPRAVPATLGAAPRAEACAEILSLRDLRVHFPVRGGLLRREVARVRAVDGVSLSLSAGRTLALVGESGCGKTTVGRAILQLEPPTEGSVMLAGQELVGANRATLHAARRQLQMVFQDPFASLDPRMRVGEILEEGMNALGIERDAAGRQAAVDRLLSRVGLDPAMKSRFPHAFSGGQRQRIAIARALAVSPRVLVCDEPTSALDVSVQAQILNLLRELQAEYGLAYLFITHNIAVVECLAHDVAVMYLGRIVESGPCETVLAAPAHPYTRMLLASVLKPVPPGATPTAAPPLAELPSPLAPPAGCHFHPRCPQAQAPCGQAYPDETRLAGGRGVRCHFPLPVTRA